MRVRVSKKVILQTVLDISRTAAQCGNLNACPKQIQSTIVQTHVLIQVNRVEICFN